MVERLVGGQRFSTICKWDDQENPSWDLATFRRFYKWVVVVVHTIIGCDGITQKHGK